MKKITPGDSRFQLFLDGYLRAVIKDVHIDLDRYYGGDVDLTVLRHQPNFVVEAAQDVEAFLNARAGMHDNAHLTIGELLTGSDWRLAGTAFYEARNGHGVGFHDQLTWPSGWNYLSAAAMGQGPAIPTVTPDGRAIFWNYPTRKQKSTTASGPSQADLATVNAHRRGLGMKPLDIADGWTTKEIADMAKSIRSKGTMTNPKSTFTPNRARGAYRLRQGLPGVDTSAPLSYVEHDEPKGKKPVIVHVETEAKKSLWVHPSDLVEVETGFELERARGETARERSVREKAERSARGRAVSAEAVQQTLLMDLDPDAKQGKLFNPRRDIEWTDLERWKLAVYPAHGSYHYMLTRKDLDDVEVGSGFESPREAKAAAMRSLMRVVNPAKKGSRGIPKTKPGQHGTLYLYAIKYKDKGNPAFGESSTRLWAYNVEHALDKFIDPEDPDWEPTAIARVLEGRSPSEFSWSKLNKWATSNPKSRKKSMSPADLETMISDRFQTPAGLAAWARSLSEDSRGAQLVLLDRATAIQMERAGRHEDARWYNESAKRMLEYYKQTKAKPKKSKMLSMFDSIFVPARRKKNPSDMLRRPRGGFSKVEGALGAGAGSLAGYVVGGVAGPQVAMLGSIVGGWMGGEFFAPEASPRRTRTGGAIGGIFGPLGAGVGAYIGARKPDARVPNPKRLMR